MKCQHSTRAFQINQYRSDYTSDDFSINEAQQGTAQDRIFFSSRVATRVRMLRDTRSGGCRARFEAVINLATLRDRENITVAQPLLRKICRVMDLFVHRNRACPRIALFFHFLHEGGERTAKRKKSRDANPRFLDDLSFRLSS